MSNQKEDVTLGVLDPVQLNRIESVHGGFLYQHLYSVGCLLLAQSAEVNMVMVELDEDIEIDTPQGRIYVQVKTRSKPIMPCDIAGAIERFEQIRVEHVNGKRKGTASFVIATNQAPSPKLYKMITNCELPNDVIFGCPLSTSNFHPALPPSWNSLSDAAAWCRTQAENLNFSLLSPESLVWKLAGLVQLAATGNTEYQHVFQTKDLPKLFEQLLVQMQDFPSPIESYRPQKQEPLLTSDVRVRIICGLSGAGKTAWASQAAIHCSLPSAYYDTGDLPGPALASTLVRELAAKFAETDQEGLRKVLLPGARGNESLRAFDAFLKQQNSSLLLVLDNAHRIPAENMRDILDATTNIQFVLLCQPNDNVRELEAITSLQREVLLGWDIDTVAEAVTDLGNVGTVQGYEQLRRYTGGLPLYVQSAAKIAASEYRGKIDALCNDLHKQEHCVETAQEIILSRVYLSFDKQIQDSLALFSLADSGLSQDEVIEVLIKALELSKSAAITILKKMRGTGIIEVFGNHSLKVHDAIRALGLQHLELMPPEVTESALKALRDLLITSLSETQNTSRLSLLTQVFLKLNDVETLIDLAGEEFFHEMGISVDILARLELASKSDSLDPSQRFWAFDGIVFAEFKNGNTEKLPHRLDAMKELIEQHELGFLEQSAYAIKRMYLYAEQGQATEVSKIVTQTRSKLPDTEHLLIFDYSHALSLWRLEKYSLAEKLCFEIIDGYYAVLGISKNEVLGKNPDAIWPIINKTESTHEHLKHLADTLELCAKNAEAQGKLNPILRLYAIKFYSMAWAPDSIVRVGQDLADEFIAIKEFQSAKEIIEQHIFPVIKDSGLISKLVQVRSQYAVILAYCGHHNDATTEIERLAPYIEGMPNWQRQELEGQIRLIERISYEEKALANRQDFPKVGRNEKCPCGSGIKYKKCHGF